MRVLELIQAAQTSLSGRQAFPETLEMPLELVTQFETLWRESEQEQRELGGNLMAVWNDDASTPYVSALRIRNDEIYRGTDAGDTVVIPPVPVATPESSPEEYQEYWRNVADFHTHPSDVSPGRIRDTRGYQPPSIEDFRTLLTQSDKSIYISFVIARATEGIFPQSEIYAMVYIKGISNPYSEQVEEIKGNKDLQIKQLVFPNAEAEIAYITAAQKMAMNTSGTESVDAANRELKRSLAQKTIGYGEKLAEIGLKFLIEACRAYNIGLYKGAQVLRTLP